MDEKNFSFMLRKFGFRATEKLYIRKELVIMEKYIADFHTSFYIT